MELTDKDVFRTYTKDSLGKVAYKALPIEELATIGAYESYQPYPFQGSGKDIQNHCVGYVLIDKKSRRTYLPSEVTFWTKLFNNLRAYPIYVTLNSGNFGYHYEVAYDEEIIV